MDKDATVSTLESPTDVASPTGNHPTLLLRHRVDDLQQDIESYIKQKIEHFKLELEGKSTEEVDAFIDEVFDKAQEKVIQCFNDMKAEVKSHAPKPPTRLEGECDADFNEKEQKYQEDVRDYKEYASTTASLMSGIMKLFTDVLTKVKKFFNDLWTWIKLCVKDIGKKISSFLKMVSDTINDGLKKLFS